LRCFERLSRLACGFLVVVVATTACASTSSLTVIPLRGQAAEQVDRDRAQCDAISQLTRDRWGFVKTKVGAVIVGVVAGAALGVMSLFASGTSVSAGEAPAVLAGAAAVGAAGGFVLGDIGGTIVALKEHRKRESAYLDRYVLCLNERGYQVRP